MKIDGFFSSSSRDQAFFWPFYTCGESDENMSTEKENMGAQSYSGFDSITLLKWDRFGGSS